MILLATVLKLARRNLTRNLRRNALSALMIGFSFASLAWLSGYTYRMAKHVTSNAVYNNHLGDVAIYKRDGLGHPAGARGQVLLSKAEQAELMATLSRRAEVDFVGRYLIGTGLLNNGCDSVPFVATGLDLDVEDRVSTHPALRWLTFARARPPLDLPALAQKYPGAITVTPYMATRLRKPKVAGDFAHLPRAAYDPSLDCASAAATAILAKDPSVQLLARDPSGDLLARDGTIARQFSTGRVFFDETQVNTTLGFLQSLFDTSGVSYLAVFLKEGVAPQAFAEALRHGGLGAASDRFSVYTATQQEMNPVDASIILWQRTVEIFVSVLIGLIVMVIIANFLTLSIAERRTEIGTMMAIGFPAKAVLSALWHEFLMIAGIGLIVGALIAHAGRLVVNAIGVPYHPPGVSGTLLMLIDFDYVRMGWQALALLAAAAISTRLALRRAAREADVVDLFRSIHGGRER